MGQIKVEKNAGGIEGLCVIEPSVHGDQRGYFMETYNQKDMEEAGLTMKFVQDNYSFFGLRKDDRQSPSSRRAWIEIDLSLYVYDEVFGRPPRGGRG